MGILKRKDISEKVETAVERLKAGETIILTDHEDRENEGDLVCLADRVTTEAVEYMTKKARGLICAALGPEIVDAIGLRPQTTDNDSPYSTPFTESVDAVEGVTTGISAEERAITLRLLTQKGVGKEKFSFPGHIFPLKANRRGLFGRTGHTEGAVELARLAGDSPAAVICEILGEAGGMARGRELEEFARRENLFVLSIEELITYLYTPVETVKMPLAQGEFILSLFPPLPGEEQPPVVLQSPARPSGSVPVRIHSQCLTGDLFGSLRCDCGDQLRRALDILAAEGGFLLYLPQEGRGIGLTGKIRAYKLQEQGLDTLEANLALGYQADQRDYLSAQRILRYYGVDRTELLTNNPDKVRALENAGFEVARRPLEISAGKHSYGYLKTKQERMGHSLSL